MTHDPDSFAADQATKRKVRGTVVVKRPYDLVEALPKKGDVDTSRSLRTKPRGEVQTVALRVKMTAFALFLSPIWAAKRVGSVVARTVSRERA